MGITRYDLYHTYYCGKDGRGEMRIKEDGEWVLYDDALLRMTYDPVRTELLEALKDLAAESKETFAHWPDLKNQVETVIAKAEKGV